MNRKLDELSRDLESRTAREIVEWALDTFDPHVAVASSFGVNSAVMLHLCTRVRPDIPVLSIDTGFLFPETACFRDQLAGQLSLNLHICRPEIPREAFLARHGLMWRSDPDACCAINKCEPLKKAKHDLRLRSWLTGISREQSSVRREARIVAWDEDGLMQVRPLATWTAEDMQRYLERHGLPQHPLRAQGYASIGCRPEEGYCTVKTRPGQHPRAGRWPGLKKTDCGLHTYGSTGRHTEVYPQRVAEGLAADRGARR